MRRNEATFQKAELLAPAGSPEGFYGAVHAGADAVYLGGAKFGARAYARNFTEREILDGIQYAHALGRKVYLTVNTLVKEREFGELYGYLLPYCEAGLDGIIVQDVGVFCAIRRWFPDIRLHASTQMTLTGKYGAKMLLEMGAARIVPSRELSLGEIREIRHTSGLEKLEIETFIHGALCYGYSGQCLFSSTLGGRSGNRGRCAQPCRLPYGVSLSAEDVSGRVTSERPVSCRTVPAGAASVLPVSARCYLLSLKDLCTLEYLPQLIEAGIDSFKIEGRMKKPEYAAGVTAIYRKYIDRYYASKHPRAETGQPAPFFSVDEEDLAKLSAHYIRSGSGSGYYFQRNGRSMVTLDSPGYTKSGEAFLAEIRERFPFRKKKLPEAKKKIDIYGNFSLGERAQLTFVWEGAAATVAGDSVQEAGNQAITALQLEGQLKKLGGTPFEAGHLFLSLDANVFYPLKELNRLRREAAKTLEEEIAGIQKTLSAKERKEGGGDGSGFPARTAQAARNRPGNGSADGAGLPAGAAQASLAKRRRFGFSVSVTTPEQWEAWDEFCVSEQCLLREVPCYGLYADGELCGADRVKRLQAPAAGKTEIPLYLSLPYILRKEDAAGLAETWKLLSLPGVSGCVARSLEGYAYLKERGYRRPVVADAGIYQWNRDTIRFWQDRLDGACLPLELTAQEQLELLPGEPEPAALPFEKMVYGRIPMMVTANCVARTAAGCPAREPGSRFLSDPGTLRSARSQNRLVFLTDRLGKKFPVACHCLPCRNIIYNCVPLSLHKELAKWKDKVGLRLNFTIEGKAETMEMLRFYFTLWKQLQTGNGVSLPFPQKEYTTGQERRGVE
ncbi:MAG: U32 family peptidase [Clostridium sp.]|jgi:putative protease|nr:U32 family peptidase [Clostridium sp.]